MKLYKFLPEKYAIQLVNEGVIRIGTLYEFRKYEDMQRGDDMEGKITIETIGTDEPIEYTKQEEIPGNFRKFIHLQPGAKLILSGKSISTIPYTCPDNYIYCCASHYSRQLMKEFDTDHCVEIHDPSKFSFTIAMALLHQGLAYGIVMGQPCIYKGHLHYQEENKSPQWLKDERYSHQHEYRFLFPPLIRRGNCVIPLIECSDRSFRVPEEGLHQQPLEPTILRCEAIRSCVRLMEK